MQPVQDLTVEDRVSRTQYQYSLDDADAAELHVWAPRLVDALHAQPQLRDVSSDQQDQGLGIALTSTARRRRGWALRPRLSTTRFTMLLVRGKCQPCSRS